MASKWDAIKSRKIRDVLRTALTDDKALSHSEVVEIVRATLADGYLTTDEMGDLNAVAKNSETMMPRSKLMLAYLVMQALGHSSKGPIALATDRQKYAGEIICDFMKRLGQPYFPKLNRDLVGVDLLMRVANPNIINQRSAGVCGEVSLLYSLAFDSPAVYAKFAIELYENGKAKLGRTPVEPGSDCRNSAPPAGIAHGDWLTAASLRDSENWFFDYDEVGGFAEGSELGELARWFERAGYTDVQYANNLIMSRDSGDINRINRLYNSGYRVVLRIHSRLLYADKQAQSSYGGNHIVVLRSPINITGQSVQLTVYTWGKGQYRIPQGNPLSPSQFLEHWYGYVAAKPF
jgi:hypothetical protein